MKLTEAKLKQMILEAYKKKYDGTGIVDFGIPSADERLRSEIGDELFDRIQSLDKSQADIMKQSLDPGYPWEVPRRSLKSFMESHGFKLLRSLSKLNHDARGPYMTLTMYKNDDSKERDFSLQYKIVQIEGKENIQYDYDYRATPTGTYDDDIYYAIRRHIEISELFEYDLEDEEDVYTISALILLKEKSRLEKLIRGDYDDPEIVKTNMKDERVFL